MTKRELELTAALSESAELGARTEKRLIDAERLIEGLKISKGHAESYAVRAKAVIAAARAVVEACTIVRAYGSDIPYYLSVALDALSAAVAELDKAGRP